MLESLAEAVLELDADPAEIDLRVADALNAGFAGLTTEEGGMLLRRFDPRDPSERALLAASLIRLSETDDIHLGSCVTPGSVVIPVALALEEAGGDKVSPRFRKAVAAGYAAGLRLGTAIGGARAMETGVWPTFLAAPLMAATTAAILRGCDTAGLANAMALSLAGRSGRLGKPAGNRTARWLAFGRAAASGMDAEADSTAGLRADPGIVSPAWLAAQSAPHLVDVDALSRSDGPILGDTGYKPFATARQGAAAVTALRMILDEHALDPARIESILVEVPAASHPLIARPLVASDRLSTLSSAAFQLAAAALAPDLLFDVARRSEPAPKLLALAKRVETRVAEDLETDWPRSWAGRVTVESDGRAVSRTVTRLDSDAGSAQAEGAVRQKFARMAASRPSEARLEAGCCATRQGRAALWRTFMSRCDSRRRELDGHAHH